VHKSQLRSGQGSCATQLLVCRASACCTRHLQQDISARWQTTKHRPYGEMHFEDRFGIRKERQHTPQARGLRCFVVKLAGRFILGNAINSALSAEELPIIGTPGCTQAPRIIHPVPVHLCCEARDSHPLRFLLLAIPRSSFTASSASTFRTTAMCCPS
jgi:hypothetical protein